MPGDELEGSLSMEEACSRCLQRCIPEYESAKPVFWNALPGYFSSSDCDTLKKRLITGELPMYRAFHGWLVSIADLGE